LFVTGERKSFRGEGERRERRVKVKNSSTTNTKHNSFQRPQYAVSQTPSRGWKKKEQRIIERRRKRRRQNTIRHDCVHSALTMESKRKPKRILEKEKLKTVLQPENQQIKKIKK